MKNSTLHLCMASLLSLILLACTAAYGQLTPSGDSYTNTAASTTNYGAKTLLDVESSQTTFIQFDLSSIPSGYTSADITKATLKLYVNAVTTAGSFNVDYVNGTWTESTIDASNAPALGTTIAASVPLTTKDKNQYILVDVTAAVQAWLSGTANDGIALVANSPLNANFDSKESTSTSHSAELDIVFAPGSGGGITGITTAAGSGLIGGGTSGTLNLSLTNACAAKQVLQWSGSAWACASAGTGTITGVTAGTDLTGGGSSGNVTLSLNTAATNALYAQLGAVNTFTTSQTVDGTLTASSSGSAIVGNSTGTTNAAVQGSGNSTGVLGVASSTSGIGVDGLETAATGPTYGVLGESESTSGEGVQGFATATSGNTVGVVGIAQSPAGYGVYGVNTATTGNIAGVYGSAASTSGTGVEGNSTAATGTTFGVTGTSASTSGIGVYGYEASTTGSTAGVLGQSLSTSGFGVEGTSPKIGVYAQSAQASVIGKALDIATAGAGLWGDSGSSDGVVGTSDTSFAAAFYNSSNLAQTVYIQNSTGNSGGEAFVAEVPYTEASGVKALAIIGDPGCGQGDNRIAIQLSQNGMKSCTNYTLTAGNNGETYVNANANETVHLRVNDVDSLVASGSGVNVVGTLSKGGGSFKIDHPLDPANKYLYHSFVESPDMKNIYDGTITTDGTGLATVTLPDWFESLNRDFRYQLTVIGQFAQAIVASKVANNQFRIQTDKPNVEVSWQVTGIRQDAFANANRIPVEVEKAPADRGRYLYPEAMGAPTSARIGYEAPPPGSEQIVHHQRPSLHSGNASPARSITLPVPPKPMLPKVAPLPHPATLSHPAAQASKPEFNQK
jgi:trimeric autotransporter adhesin